MKAVVYHHYGPPDVLKYEDVEKPVPKDNDLLIKVRAASLNPLDWHFMRGTPYLFRMIVGLRKPKFIDFGAGAKCLSAAQGTPEGLPDSCSAVL